MENKKFKRYGLIIYYILKAISKSLKMEIRKSPKIKSGEGYICSFWHNKLVGASLSLVDFSEKRGVLASPSQDGELIAVPLERLGFHVIRGSSDKNSVKSLLGLLKLMKEGYSIGTPLDGPKGPIYEVKPGLVYIAQKSGRPIVPIGIAFSNKWVFKKSWDKFQLPKPFSKVLCLIGDPIEIGKDSSLEEAMEMVREALIDINERAESVLKGERDE